MVKIDNKAIGDGEPVYIVFEIGPTHNGFESAKNLITHAANAGADAVKFQVLDAERLVRDPAMPVEYGYLVNRETGETARHTESLREVLKRRALTRDEWLRLKRHADSLNIAFFATASFTEELDFLQEIGCTSIKLASLDINHFPLMKEVAERGFCVQLDTGNATIGEIERAVDYLIENGSSDFIIHHCPSGYPARLTSINLKTITTLKQMFSCPIAFSDHTPGWSMDIAATTLGVNLIEKTITEDRTCMSPEHVMSLEPNELKHFVSEIRELEIALGSTRRVLTAEESNQRSKRRRSAFLAKAAPKGTAFGDLQIEYGRPGLGLQPHEIDFFADAELAIDLQEETLLMKQHFCWKNDS